MSIPTLGLGFLFSALDHASPVMDKIRSGLLNTEGKANEASKSIGAAFKGVGIAGAVMAGAGVAIFAALSPALEEASKFSKAIALVATETDEATFAQEKMRGVAEQLAITYGKAPVNQANALYKAVALGANTAAKSQDFLNGVNLLAVAGNADLETSANALGGALNAYGADFKQATSYSDTLFTGMRLGNTTVQDLASSVGRVTATAHNLGVSFDEIVGATAVMTNQGVKADEAVSGLKEALANVVHPSAKAAAEAARLGIKFNQTELRAKGLRGFLDEITHSAKFNANSLSTLFESVEGGNAIMQVTTGSMSQFNSVMDSMRDKSGATQRGFDIMSDTLDFQEQKFLSTKKVVVGMIGSALEPLAKTVLMIVNTIMEGFAKAPKPLVSFLTYLALGTGAMLTFGGVILAVVGGLGAMAVAVATGIAGATVAIPAFLAGIEAITAAVAAVGAVLWPITLILVGFGVAGVAAMSLITLAVVGFKKAWDDNLGRFRDNVERIVDDVQLAVKAIGEVFSTGGFTKETWDKFTGHEDLKEFVITLYMWGSRVMEFFKGISKGFSENMPDFKPLSQAIFRIEEAFGHLVGGSHSPDAASKRFAAFGKAGATVGTLLAEVFTWLVGVVEDVVGAAVDLVDGWNAAGDTFSFVGDGVMFVVDMFGDLFAAIGQAMVDVGLMSNRLDDGSSKWRVFGTVAGVALKIIEIGLIALVAPLVIMMAPLLLIVWALSKIIDLATEAAVRLGLMEPAVNKHAARGISFNGGERTAEATSFARPGSMFGFAGGMNAGLMNSTMPATAAAGQAATAPTDTSTMAAHLANIAKNTSQPASFTARVMLDGNQIGTAMARSHREQGTRGFAPAPVEGD